METIVGFDGLPVPGMVGLRLPFVQMQDGGVWTRQRTMRFEEFERLVEGGYVTRLTVPLVVTDEVFQDGFAVLYRSLSVPNYIPDADWQDQHDFAVCGAPRTLLREYMPHIVASCLTDAQEALLKDPQRARALAVVGLGAASYTSPLRAYLEQVMRAAGDLMVANAGRRSE